MEQREHSPNDSTLRVYLLPTMEYESYLAFQRRLIYDIGGDPALATLVVCDHPDAISIGREGSRSHVRLSPAELISREWRVHWAARGGGVLLHTRGQICLYPILPLAQLKLTPMEYLQKSLTSAKAVLERYANDVTIDWQQPGIRIRSRRVLHFGSAIRFGVTAFGMVLNVCPDLELFERMACDGDSQPMTSLERESPYRIELPTIRRELAESIRATFGIVNSAYFHSQPKSLLKNITHANSARSRTS